MMREPSGTPWTSRNCSNKAARSCGSFWLASVVGVGVFFERLWSTQRARVLPRAFVDRIRALVAKGKTNEALLLCEENGSSIALIMAAALRAYEHSTNRSEIKEAVEEVGAREVGHMDRNVEVVGTVATISPLLGLLGTVVGMIQVFREFVEAFASGNVGPDTFAQGIWQALITTAYGLIVAIPVPAPLPLPAGPHRPHRRRDGGGRDGHRQPARGQPPRPRPRRGRRPRGEPAR
jgi:biopolymer transport protein ExbB/TolQ